MPVVLTPDGLDYIPSWTDSAVFGLAKSIILRIFLIKNLFSKQSVLFPGSVRFTKHWVKINERGLLNDDEWILQQIEIIWFRAFF